MCKAIHRFEIAVNCSSEKDREQIYYDHGMLMLPSGYSEDGEPVRLVISCHGAGGTVSTNDSQVEQQVLTKYLLANGYAVMDVNGLPNDYAAIEGIDIRNNIGSPIAIQSYVKAYRYCIDNFNLKKEVFVHGASMGGISSTNLVMSKSIPVIAQSGFCPVLDTYNQIFLHPWTGGAPKVALGRFYQLEVDEHGELIYDEDKIMGFNPVSHISYTDGKEYLAYPVPLKFWHCEDDEIVSIESTKRFVSAINNAGGIAHLYTFETGGHSPQESGDFVESPSGNTKLKNEKLMIKPAEEEVLLWIRHFDQAER